MKAKLLACTHSAAFLPADGNLRRTPKSPWRRRPQGFYESFEDLALVYDCFWHADGKRILVVGPPPIGLEEVAPSFVARPSGTALGARLHASASVGITELTGVPPGTEAVVLRFGEHRFRLHVQPNFSHQFAGRRIVFTMSKNNDLPWIAEWARYHARVQGADAVVFFDNGSTTYDTDEIKEVLLGIPGLEHVAVHAWPYRYGSPDPALLSNPFYTLFLQIASMSVVLRRYGAEASGILNCDVDELVASPPDSTVFDLARQSRQGLLVMRGRYIEPVPLADAPAEGRTHRHYALIHNDPARRLSRQKKWAIDPNRNWFADLGVHPYMHWIHGRPWFGKSQPKNVFYRHFRAITTGWKDNRAEASIGPAGLETDREFLDTVALYTDEVSA